MDKMRLRDALLDFFFPCGECLSCGSMAKVRNGLCEKCREKLRPAPAGGRPGFGWIDDLLGGTMEKRLREHFTIPGYIFLLNCEQAQRYNIMMLSSVSPETVAPMGLKAYGTVEELLAAADLKDKSIYVIPNGSTVVPYVKGA